jgi:hypothetical protein
MSAVSLEARSKTLARSPSVSAPAAVEPDAHQFQHRLEGERVSGCDMAASWLRQMP